MDGRERIPDSQKGGKTKKEPIIPGILEKPLFFEKKGLYHSFIIPR